MVIKNVLLIFEETINNKFKLNIDNENFNFIFISYEFIIYFITISIKF